MVNLKTNSEKTSYFKCVGLNFFSLTDVFEVVWNLLSTATRLIISLFNRFVNELIQNAPYLRTKGTST